MNLPAALFVIRCLVTDTFRQALSARTFWMMLAVSGLCILFCLSISVQGPRTLQPKGEIELYGGDNKPLSGPNPQPGYVTLGFGAIRLWMFRGSAEHIHFLQVLFAKWLAGAAGTLLVLVWTAGFLPEFLQPTAASVLLAKPAPRWSLIVGKYLGVLVFVAFQATVFVVGTWLALGLRTGSWLPGYLVCLPLLLLNFAVLYSFSTLMAVWTRSTVTCILATLLFWLVCAGMNYARHAVQAQPVLAPEAPSYSGGFLALTEAAYWIVPKPIDFLMLLDQALQAAEHFGSLPSLAIVEKQGNFSPELSILSSLAFAALVLAAAAWHLSTTDY